MAKKKSKPNPTTKGLHDVVRIFKHFEDEMRRARRVNWLREHWSKLKRGEKDKLT